ncbi:hypothetical protein BH09ACT7_BH09ACT7_39570 [soil metagenome]
MHTGHPSQEPVELAQPFDEPCDRDDLAAVPVQVILGGIQSLQSEEQIAAEPLDDRAAAEVPDREADVVPDDRADDRHQDDQRDVEVTRAGEDGGRDQYRLARHGHAEVLQEDEPAGPPSYEGSGGVVLQDGLQVTENAW